MLANGLAEIQALLRPENEGEPPGSPGIVTALRGMRLVWDEAAFSAIPDHSLKRYLNYHLEGISKISDTLYGRANRRYDEELLRLIDHLEQFYLAFLDRDIAAPLLYRNRLLGQLEEKTNLLLAHLGANKPRSSYRYLADYILDVRRTSTGCTFSFRALDYFQLLVSELCRAVAAGQCSIGQVLLELNFNQVGYLRARQQQIGEMLAGIADRAGKLVALNRERDDLISTPVRLETAYHPDWPSLKDMLYGWLTEQIGQLAGEQEPSCAKLALHLSVAQLACLLRLCFEEGFFKEGSLKVIFHFIAKHYSAKKQQVISPGSLSKEFYSISQITAAVMRDRLLKMTARINRSFFPALIVAGAAIAFH